MTRHPTKPGIVAVHSVAAHKYFGKEGGAPAVASPCSECPDRGASKKLCPSCNTTPWKWEGRIGHDVWVTEVTAVAMKLED